MTPEERAAKLYGALNETHGYDDYDAPTDLPKIAAAIREAENEALERAWRAIDALSAADNWERCSVDDAFECALSQAQDRILALKHSGSPSPFEMRIRTPEFGAKVDAARARLDAEDGEPGSPRGKR